ncbi:spore protease YyaC [Paenibacillus pinihumi]|uniref:spore protease YyaC n=1 Tax=Paenibacillus pinihumi TaxID=669462 RepID=UPI00316AD248
MRISTGNDRERGHQRRLSALKSEPHAVRKRMNDEELLEFLTEVAGRHPNRDELLFVCIGTDCSTGDAFGPLIGSMLEDQGWPHVIGTMQSPCDANRLAFLENEMLPGKIVIAIDACLGKPLSVGGYLAAGGPIRPAQAVGAIWPQVGNYSIAGVVNMIGPKPYMTLQTTSLHTVMQMAAKVAEQIGKAWGVRDN